MILSLSADRFFRIAPVIFLLQLLFVLPAHATFHYTSGTCTSSAPLTIRAFISQGVTCVNGSNGIATARVRGGTGTYTFSWSTAPSQTTATATGLSAGSYIVQVIDSLGAIASTSITITTSSALNTTHSVIRPKCNGNSNGSAQAIPTGGTGSYSYSWHVTPAVLNQTLTGLAAGIYVVTVKDSTSCTVNDTVNVTQPATLQGSITQAPVSCSLSLTAIPSGGTTPYQYSWNTTPVQTTKSALVNTSGLYTVMITDSSMCTTIDTVTATVPPRPATPVITLVGGNLVSSTSSGNQWLLNGVQISSATGQTFGPSVNGTYTVQVTLGTCTVSSAPYSYTIAGIAESIGASAGFRLYPNPSEGSIHIVCPAENGEQEFRLKICSLLGQELLVKNVLGVSGLIDVTTLPAGIYFVTLEGSKGNSSGISKLIIRK